MFLIRSIAEAMPGRRDEAVRMMDEMNRERQKELGYGDWRILTGSIGPSDSMVVTESVVESIAEFEQQLEATNKWAGMQRYGKAFAELCVPGTHRFEIFRIQK